MFTKAIIPLDGSELAARVLPYVTQMARGLDISLLLLSVVDTGDLQMWKRLRPQDEEGAGASTSGTSAVLAREVQKDLDNVASRLKEQGVKVEAQESVGEPAEEILRVAELEGCNLIAMATHGRNALGRGIFGSVTDKVMQTSQLPVLAIAPENARQYWQHGVTITRVLVPLDGSALAETSLPYVEDIARKLSLDIALVSVVNTPSAYTSLRGRGSTDALVAELEAEADEYLVKVAESLQAKGFTVQRRVLRGSPARAIVNLAQERPEDMIVLTTRGHSGFTRWSMGSVAENTMRASGNPVLVIPPKRPGSS